MSDVNYPIGSVEYIKATVTADFQLNAQPVAISIDEKATWLPATWVGSAGLTRQVRTTSPYTFTDALGARHVYVKVTDSPEVPIIKTPDRLSAS